MKRNELNVCNTPWANHKNQQIKALGLNKIKKRKPNPKLVKLALASKNAVKLGMTIVHEVSGHEQTLTEFGLHFWKTCHPIERKGWRIKSNS